MSVGTSMNVNGVANNGQENKKTEANDVLGKDAFLKLLMTQMQYQDPLEPMDNTEFVAQTAQFSALEQMTNVYEAVENITKYIENMNTSVVETQVLGYLGKNVTAIDPTTKLPIKGKIEGVALVDGVYQLTVSGVTDGKGEPIFDKDGNQIKEATISVSDIVQVTAGA